MAQVDEIGQVRPLVQFDGRRDLDHLQERDGSLLHTGAARARDASSGSRSAGRPLAPPM